MGKTEKGKDNDLVPKENFCHHLQDTINFSNLDVRTADSSETPRYVYEIIRVVPHSCGSHIHRHESLIFHTEGEVFTNNILVSLLGLTRTVSNISLFTNLPRFLAVDLDVTLCSPLLPPFHKEHSKLGTTERLLLPRDTTPLPHPLCMTCC